MSDSDSDDEYYDYDYSSLIYQYDSEEDEETREMRLEDEWCERELQKKKRNGFQPTEDEALKFDEVRRQIEANDPNVLPKSITYDDRFCLDMSSDFWPYDGDWSGAGRAIANNEYLKELYLGDYRDPAHEMNTNTKEQFSAFWGLVSGSTSITKLSLCNYSLLGGSEFFTLMGNFIGKQIVELHIDKADMNNEGASVFASTLSKGNVLQTLSIGGSVSVDPWCYRGSGGADPLTNEGWKSIVGCLQSPHCKITSLSISESTMDDSTASILANGLKNNPYLKKLLMGKCKGVTNSGWQAIFSALETNSALEQLSLSKEASWLRPDPGLDEGVVATLLNSLTNNRTLKSLDVMKITEEGLRSFIPLLRSPHSNLEEFRSTETPLTIELAALLASSLVGDTKLKRLVLEHDSSASVQILATFLGLVCNKLNIMATYQSNHTLQEIGGTRYSSRNHEVYSMLQVNKNSNSPAAAARSKIIKTHFSDVNVKEFVDMDEEVYPQAAAWMAKDMDGLSLLYKFLTSIPLDLDGYAAFARAGYDVQSRKKQKL